MTFLGDWKKNFGGAPSCYSDISKPKMGTFVQFIMLLEGLNSALPRKVFSWKFCNLQLVCSNGYEAI